METFSNLLILAGTGQNCGKTTIACDIVKKFSQQFNIVTLKITPHRYPLTPNQITIVDTEEMLICEETDTQSTKDSALMLQSGASKSYFVMCNDDFVLKAFNFIESKIPKDSLIVCESGGLPKYVQPGLFFLITRNDHHSTKPGIEHLKAIASKYINTDTIEISNVVKSIVIQNGKWELTKER